VLVGKGQSGVSDADSVQPRQRRQPSSFGELLLTRRHAAGLTQEELAGKAGMSVRALSNLERGDARSAQRNSAHVLADALGLADEQRTEFLRTATAARRRSTQITGISPPPQALCAPPAMVVDLVGREEELGRLRSWARRATDAPSGSVVSIVGPPGIGKTTLAVAAVRHLADEFPDGCLAVDLRGMDTHPLPAGTALDRMLRALGLDPGQIPHSMVEQSGLFRSMLPDRRLLVLLDNANDEAQVRPLLAAGHGCLTIITCRRTLSGLEGVRWLRLDPLSTPHAVELVASIADPDRVRAEPDAARQLVELCGNLPLAVRIVGNRLAREPRWTLAGLTGQLRDERARLTTLTAGDLQVRTAFVMSYQRLSPSVQLMFRRLALVPGADFGAELAAVAAGTDRTEAGWQLEELIETTLVQPAATPGRYQFHDLIRIFARERLETEETAPERDGAANALHKHLLDTATAAGPLFDPDSDHHTATNAAVGTRDQAAEWLDQESSNWLAAARHASAAGWHRELIALARAMHWFSDGHDQYPWADVFGWAVAAAQAVGDRHAEAVLLNFLGWAQYYRLGDTTAGLATHQRALATAVEIGDRREQAWALGYLGAVLMRLGRLAEALDHNERATALFIELDYWPALNSMGNSQGKILRMLGRYDEALAAHRAVLADLSRAVQMESVHPYHRAYTLSLIGEVMLDLCDWPQAAATFHEARALISEKELPTSVGQYALHEGTARRESGEHAAAAQCLQVALTLFTDAPTRWWRARTCAELAATLEATGAVDEAGHYRREALVLCQALDTEQARTLAAELSRRVA
jgi:tetratricopeptide (TPR) repeat protein/transcriptional regulator with XRE-family HTH domain